MCSDRDTKRWGWIVKVNGVGYIVSMSKKGLSIEQGGRVEYSISEKRINGQAKDEGQV